MAARDLPAMLTHELMVTGAAHISYIGHSQGTTIGMAFLASHAGSALAEHIKVCISCTTACRSPYHGICRSALGHAPQPLAFV